MLLVQGFVVLYVAARVLQSIEVEILYRSLVLFMVRKAGRDVPLKAFLTDQFRSSEPRSNEDDEKVESCGKVWWRCPWFLGFILAFFFLSNAPWKVICLISSIAMALGFLCFLLGISFYNLKKPTGSALTAILRVLKAAILRNWRLCTPAEVKEVELILTMIPIWIIFLVYSLVAATGSTFFFEQSYDMKPRIGRITSIPVNIFLMIQGSAHFMTIDLCDLLLPKLQIIRTPRLRFLLQIGLGMISSILCCITAWRVEKFRLKNASDISIFWLYCLINNFITFFILYIFNLFLTLILKN